MTRLTAPWSVVVSWTLHTIALLLFVTLLSGLSLPFIYATGFSLLFVFVVSFSRFSLMGIAGATAYLGGAVASTLWFPLAVATLDWAIGGGAPPSDSRFYLSAFKYIYSREALSFTWIPAAAMIVTDLLGLGLGFLTHRLFGGLRRGLAGRTSGGS